MIDQPYALLYTHNVLLSLSCAKLWISWEILMTIRQKGVTIRQKGVITNQKSTLVMYLSTFRVTKSIILYSQKAFWYANSYARNQSRWQWQSRDYWPLDALPDNEWSIQFSECWYNYRKRRNACGMHRARSSRLKRESRKSLCPSTALRICFSIWLSIVSVISTLDWMLSMSSNFSLWLPWELLMVLAIVFSMEWHSVRWGWRMKMRIPTDTTERMIFRQARTVSLSAMNTMNDNVQSDNGRKTTPFAKWIGKSSSLEYSP